MELVNCRILRCHATNGGGLYISMTSGGRAGAIAKMTRGTVSECSANIGGGVYAATPSTALALVDVLVTKCRATGGDGDNGGGGI